MKKLILSAFALSLCMPVALWAQSGVVDTFLGLESEILPELVSDQKFTKSSLHQHKEWQVEEKQVVIDKQPLKGQKFSLIDWSELDPNEWMNIDVWLLDRKKKDSLPNWKLRLRDDKHNEIVGKVLKCRGTCPVFRGTNSANVQHLSQIQEGDELRTEKDSIAWVYLMDGTLVRVAPESSISFQEISWTNEGVFFLARLNQGHVYWHPRSRNELAKDEGAETDTLSLPLLVRGANFENFEREIYQSQNNWERMTEVHSLFDNAVTKQFEAIQNIKTKNNAHKNLYSKVMLVAPNATLIGKNASFDFLYTPGGQSYFTKRNSSETELSLHLRGYNDAGVFTISDSGWHEVEPLGRNHRLLDSPHAELTIAELLTKRIRSIELAREIWFSEFTAPILADLSDHKKLAIDHGYSLWWESAGQKRFDFLVEYTRRLETTNIKSVDNLLKKLEEKGEKVNRNLSDAHFRASLNSYLLGLKTRYTDKKMQVREMNDLQYYVWILKNGKI